MTQRRRAASSRATFGHCGSTGDAEPVDADADADADAHVDADAGAGGMCFVDYPCFDGAFQCTGSTTYVPVVTQDCHYTCGPGPCSGGSCDPSGPEEKCPSGTVCVRGPLPVSATSPCFAPGVALDGGPPGDADTGSAQDASDSGG